MESYGINDLQSYISIIKELKEKNKQIIEKESAFEGKIIINPNYIFRGHSRASKYKLLPGIFREEEKQEIPGYKKEKYFQNEFEILNDFICEACSYVSGIEVNDYVAYLEIAQHYGLPTRLLDFTFNPLVALFFACKTHEKEDGVVWYLDEKSYKDRFYPGHNLHNSIVFSKTKVKDIVTNEILNNSCNIKTKYDIFPWIYKPMYRENRMSMQSSTFLLWAKNRDTLDGMINKSFEEKQEEQNILGRIEIPAEKKREIIKDLDSCCGVNSMFVYPGLDGVGKYLNEKYENPINPLNWSYHRINLENK